MSSSIQERYVNVTSEPSSSAKADKPVPDPAKYQVNSEDAPRIWDWIQNRGGIQIWESVDLSMPGHSLTVPLTDPNGVVNDKPPDWRHQQAGRIITSPDDVEVCIDKEVKRFHVGTQRADMLRWEVTSAGSKRIRQEVEKAGKGAYHVFDYGDYKNAVIMAPEKILPLREFIAQQEKPSGQENQTPPAQQG